MKVLESSLEKLAQSIAKEHQLECNILWTEGFQTNENNKKAADYIRTAAKPMILKYWKKNSFYLGKILAFLPSNILARCLALALE
jgi:metal-dependent amidase/aminoacylase/carboxypeptidase family protein